MASPRAIAAAVEALCAVLRRRIPIDAPGQPVATRAVTPARLRGLHESDGIAVCLWRVAVDSHVRAQPPGREPFARAETPPVAVDLWLLVVPHAPSVATQQHLLGRVLAALAGTPRLEAADLNAAAGGEPVFGPEESLQLVLEQPAAGDERAAAAVPADLPPLVSCRVGPLFIDREEERMPEERKPGPPAPSPAPVIQLLERNGAIAPGTTLAILEGGLRVDLPDPTRLRAGATLVVKSMASVPSRLAPPAGTVDQRAALVLRGFQAATFVADGHGRWLLTGLSAAPAPDSIFTGPGRP
jgi:hypothetical protein